MGPGPEQNPEQWLLRQPYSIIIAKASASNSLELFATPTTNYYTGSTGYASYLNDPGNSGSSVGNNPENIAPSTDSGNDALTALGNAMANDAGNGPGNDAPSTAN